MPTERSSVLGRVRSFLRESSPTAWVLGAAISVGLFFGVGEYVVVPESVLWLLVAGVGPAVYYRLHYESVDVESSFGRRAFRANVLLVTWTITSSASIDPVPDALRFVALWALFDAVSTSARLDVVYPGTDSGRDDDQGDDGGRVVAVARRIGGWVRSRRVVRALQSRRRSMVATLREDSGLAWWLGVIVGGGAALAAWYWYRVPSIVLWGFVAGLGAMVYYWTHYEWRNRSETPREWVWLWPTTTASIILVPEAGYVHWFVVYAALGSLGYVVWYSAGLSVAESPRSSEDAVTSEREEAARREPPWERSGWADRGGD